MDGLPNLCKPPSGIRAALGYVLAAMMLAFTAASAQASPSTQPVCAIILPSDASARLTAAAGAIEMELSRRGSVRLLDREHVDEVLGEQRRQMLFAPQAGPGRVEVGRLLNADLLLVLEDCREVAAGAARADGAKPPEAGADASAIGALSTGDIDLAVCETTGGLRLALARLSAKGIEGSLSATSRPSVSPLAELVEDLLTTALRKRSEGIRQIVAVPPLACGDLDVRYDLMEGPYAHVLEAALLARRGVVVVELAEARAVARERQLALLSATGVSARRLVAAMPLVLLGEYAHDRKDPAALTLSLQLKRGGKEVHRCDNMHIRANDAAALLSRTATDWMDALDAQPAAASGPADLRPEALEFARRAMIFWRLGSWLDTASLAEASLLIDPHQSDLRLHAALAYSRLARKAYRPNATDPSGVPDGGADETGPGLFFRALDHLQVLAGEAPDAHAFEAADVNPLAIVNEFERSGVIFNFARRAVSDQMSRDIERERQGVLDIVRLRARGGCGDEGNFMSWAVRGLPPEACFDLLFDTFCALRDTPPNPHRVVDFAFHQCSPRVLACPEGIRFLDRLAALGDPGVRLEALRLKGQIHSAQLRATSGDSSLVPAPVKADPGAGQITFTPIHFLSSPSGAAAELVVAPGYPSIGCMPAGAGLDLFFDNRAIYLMKEKDRLQRIWDAGGDIGFAPPCFDGRFAWFAVEKFKGQPLLLVIEPSSGRVWQIGAEAGLGPMTTAGDVNFQRDTRTAAAVALAPGKICLGGSLGRAWCAMVSFNPDAVPQATVNIFHEARDRDDPKDRGEWTSTRLAFAPAYMFALGNAPAALPLPGQAAPATEAGVKRVAAVPRQIVLGRILLRARQDNDVINHPLLIDPVSLEVQVDTQAIPASPSALIADGPNLFWVACSSTDPLPMSPSLWRLNLSDPVARPVAEHIADSVANAPIVPRLTSAHVLLFQGDRVLSSATPDGRGPYSVLRGSPPEPNAAAVPVIFQSVHYGMIWKSLRGQLYEITGP